MTDEHLAIVIHLGAALLAGGLIGLERTFHGRPAGFRTHSLVCLASSLLMLLTLYQEQWGARLSQETMRLDPTRMAQGIMTGIGFLGAGVIFKEGLSVRGLTTAASIWITAGIGIMLGAGFYFPAALATLAALGILSVFRWLERLVPTEFYANHRLRFRRDSVIPEDRLRELIQRHGFSIGRLTYRLRDGGSLFEYEMVIRSARRGAFAHLAQTLHTLPDLVEFEIAPASD
jgi:putative Mg2+ transporter-C (MgtC) family protein